MTSKRPFFSTAIFVGLGRIGGLVIPFIIAFYYGVSAKTDAFFLAYQWILAITSFFSPVFLTVLVPALAGYKEDNLKVSQLSNGVMAISLPVIMGFSFLIAFIFIPIFAKSSGIEASTAKLLWRLYLEMLPFVLFGTLIMSQQSIFYTYKNFWFPAVSPLIRSLCVIFGIFFFYKALGIHAVSWGFTAGELLRWGIGLALLLQFSIWKPSFNWTDYKKEMKTFFMDARIQTFAFLVINLIPIIDQWFASFMGNGNISLLSYAERIYQIVYILATTEILHIFLADWSESKFKDSSDQLWKKVKRDIRNVSAICLAISVALFLSKGLLVKLFFGFSDMSPDHADMVAHLLGWFAIGFTPSIVNHMYTRFLFVKRKYDIFLLQGAIKLVLNIIFNYFFMKWFGLIGIVISTAMIYTVAALWLSFYVKRHMQAQSEGN